MRAGVDAAAQGTVYTSCTADHDPGSELWCSTRVDTRGEHVPNGGHWGFCGDTCQGHAGAGDTHAEIQLVSNDIDEGELLRLYSAVMSVYIIYLWKMSRAFNRVDLQNVGLKLPGHNTNNVAGHL